MKRPRCSTLRSHSKLGLISAATLETKPCRILWPESRHAQGTAQISRVVTDSSAASVPSAQVEITNTDANAIRTMYSADDGSFDFPALSFAPHKLRVTKQGFQSFVQCGIVLQPNTNPTVTVALASG
jgi:hypothetical protein